MFNSRMVVRFILLTCLLSGLMASEKRSANYRSAIEYVDDAQINVHRETPVPKFNTGANNQRVSALSKPANDGKYQLTEQLTEINFFDPPLKVKSVFEYDGQHNQIFKLEQSWRGSKYENSSKEISTYTEKNLQLNGVYFSWNAGAWVEGNTYTLSYDSSDRPIRSIYTYKDGSTGKTTNYLQVLFTYDSLGHMVNETNQYWDTNAWIDSYRNLFTYDDNGNLIEIEGQYSENNNWKKSERLLYTYDDSNRKITELIQYRETGSWDDYYKWESSYDSNDLETGALGYLWDGSSWENQRRKMFTYDEHGNITYYIMEGTDDDGSTWWIALEEWSTFGFIVTGINEELSEVPTQLKLHQNFPNPFNPSTSIQFSLPEASDVKLQIFDLRGNELSTLVQGYRAAGTYTVMLDGSDMPSGTYIYRLQTGNSTQTRKLLLLK